MSAEPMRPLKVSPAPGRDAPQAIATIDVHHHFNPTLKDNEGNPWSVQMAIEEMDRNFISTAIASLGPVNDAGSKERPRRVRDWNEWGIRTCLDHPGRFGLFASIPVPDIDLALVEITYAYDVLHADGIGLSTNEGDIWLGDERNWPVFAELNRRKAVVFVHPAPTSNCASVSRAYGGDLISSPWLEFPMNTARAILGLLAKGVTRKYPDIRFIFSHGGGAMPFLLGRIAGFSGWQTVGPEKLKALFPDGIYAEFGKLYFDLAQALAPEVLQFLRQVVPESHLLFGSDFSYFAIASSVEQFSGLNLNEDVRRAVGGENAATLFPRFQAERHK
jgi:predicted TIM-barrel fold metal-dependent hydrolase